jgi:hypothetical protein
MPSIFTSLEKKHNADLVGWVSGAGCACLTECAIRDRLRICSLCRFQKDLSMKLVLTLLGVVLLVVAAVYFLVPADQLPSFFPGHETGLARIRTKHGITSGVAGVVLLAVGVWIGRR